MEGKESHAKALQTQLTEALGALAATSDVAASPASGAQVRRMRETVFSLIASAARSVKSMLGEAGISESLLQAIAPAPSSMRGGGGACWGGAGGGGGRGSGSGSGGGGPSSGGDGLSQPGLLSVVDNPTGRRMKAVAMTADEVARALQVRLMGLGLMKGLGTKKRQSRVAHKLFALSLGLLARRLREARRRATPSPWN